MQSVMNKIKGIGGESIVTLSTLNMITGCTPGPISIAECRYLNSKVICDTAFLTVGLSHSDHQLGVKGLTQPLSVDELHGTIL